MAEGSSRDSRIGMIAKFFPGAKSDAVAGQRPASSASDGKDATATINDVSQIKQLIEIAVTNGSAITVRIPGEKICFTTHFAASNANDFKTSDGHLCLLVAPLNPPLGNIKMRGAPYLTINFFTDLFVVESKVKYLKNLEDRSIQLSFPREMTRGEQKRSNSRIVVDPKLNIKANIKRPAGFSFAVKIFDISVGGVAFYSEETIPPMLENTRVIFTISRLAQRDIELTANTLGALTKEGKTCYRAVFVHKGDSQKEIERLINFIVEKIRDKRQKLFE